MIIYKAFKAVSQHEPMNIDETAHQLTGLFGGFCDAIGRRAAGVSS
ncbi:MAG: hypothetical protein MZU91_01945 [Desulfosudis oleivorans]|nr:hypothetical protein [Desulfosudis oleivorans]